MDGATSSLEDEFAPPGVLPDYAKKVVPADNLVELALLYRERAKRGGEGWHERGREGAAPTTVGARDGAAVGGKWERLGFASALLEIGFCLSGMQTLYTMQTVECLSDFASRC
jgi:hypothetical protein